MSGPIYPAGSTTIITGSNAGNNSVPVAITTIVIDDLGAVKSLAGAAALTNLYVPVNGVYRLDYIGSQSGGSGAGSPSVFIHRMSAALVQITDYGAGTYFNGNYFNGPFSEVVCDYFNAGEVMQVIPSCGATGSPGNTAWRIALTLLHQTSVGSAPQVI